MKWPWNKGPQDPSGPVLVSVGDLDDGLQARSSSGGRVGVIDRFVVAHFNDGRSLRLRWARDGVAELALMDPNGEVAVRARGLNSPNGFRGEALAKYAPGAVKVASGRRPEDMLPYLYELRNPSDRAQLSPESKENQILVCHGESAPQDLISQAWFVINGAAQRGLTDLDGLPELRRDDGPVL